MGQMLNDVLSDALQSTLEEMNIQHLDPQGIQHMNYASPLSSPLFQFSVIE
jgi:hypothetical protein